MRVLAIETSTEIASVAVMIDGRVTAERASEARARHGETLLPLLAEALAESGIAKADVDLVAVGLGPGSFTGTRVGVAIAKGLALGLDRPLVGVVSLLAMSRDVPGRWLAPAIDAYKGEVYVALFEREGNALVERVAPFHDLPERAAARIRAAHAGELVSFGTAIARHPAFSEALGAMLVDSHDVPTASAVAREGLARFVAHGPDDRASLEPAYVRDSDATLPA